MPLRWSARSVRLLLLAALVAVAGAARATPITYSFEGVVTVNNVAGGPTGQSVAGWITVDPTTYDFVSSDSTQRYGAGSYYAVGAGLTPVQATPSQARGFASDGATSVSVGGGSTADSASTYVARGYIEFYTGLVQNWFIVQANSSEAGGGGRGIILEVFDSLGSATQIFSTPAGDLSLDQDVDWFAAGSTNLFVFYESSSSGVQQPYLSGYLTAVTVSAVPEPSTFALAGTALLILAFLGIGKRRSAIRPSA